MYVMITSRCNMSCEHCCSNCTAEGQDMSYETWSRALAFVLDYGGEFISLGGGEPTLHPLFWQILGESIAHIDSVWLATNGSITNTALALAKMAGKGVISCALSQDIYHDPIDHRVVEAFTKRKPSMDQFGSHLPIYGSSEDYREIRDVSGNEVMAGRCWFGDEARCVCPDIVIMPDGTIKGCGCSDAPSLGTVFAPQIPDNWNWGDCHKSEENVCAIQAQRDRSNDERTTDIRPVQEDGLVSLPSAEAVPSCRNERIASPA